MPTPAEHLKDLAWECRQLAAGVSNEATRRDLTAVAERFERLARMRQQEKRSPIAPAVGASPC